MIIKVPVTLAAAWPAADELLDVKGPRNYLSDLEIHFQENEYRPGFTTGQIREEDMDGRSRDLSESDMRILRTLLGRYAARYHLTGPEKDDLIERTFGALASNPDIFFEIPVEKAAAETMHRIYIGG